MVSLTPQHSMPRIGIRNGANQQTYLPCTITAHICRHNFGTIDERKPPLPRPNLAKRPSNDHLRYHAHVYFDEHTLDHATWLCNEAGNRFSIKVGQIIKKPVGPHPHWSCQLLFNRDKFDDLIPWLETNRDGLTILVHGDTGDDFADHTDHAAWLGSEATLDLSLFDSRQR